MRVYLKELKKDELAGSLVAYRKASDGSLKKIIWKTDSKTGKKVYYSAPKGSEDKVIKDIQKQYPKLAKEDIVFQEKKKMIGQMLAEKQTTKKGSKIDLTQLDAEELKKILEEKLGTELTWDEYSWTATGEFAGCEVTLNFIESDKGNKYQLSYAKEGSIHDRSVWEDDNMDDFEKDSDAMIVELGDYAEKGEAPAEEDSEEELDDSEESAEEEELDFGESAPRWVKGERINFRK